MSLCLSSSSAFFDPAFPFCLDCATSVTQRGKIEQYARMGKELPPGWVVDHEGKTCTDPQKVLQGLIDGTCALTPIGGLGEETAGYKGSVFVGDALTRLHTFPGGKRQVCCANCDVLFVQLWLCHGRRDSVVVPAARQLLERPDGYRPGHRQAASHRAGSLLLRSKR